MFVCASRGIAYKLYREILALRPQWNEIQISECLSDKEKKEVKPIERVKMVMPPVIKTMKRNCGIYWGIKKKEKSLTVSLNKSNFKIAIVVDMWLPGFDIPFLDTIYIDKLSQTHNLI